MLSVRVDGVTWTIRSKQILSDQATYFSEQLVRKFIYLFILYFLLFALISPAGAKFSPSWVAPRSVAYSQAVVWSCSSR